MTASEATGRHEAVMVAELSVRDLYILWGDELVGTSHPACLDAEPDEPATDVVPIIVVRDIVLPHGWRELLVWHWLVAAWLVRETLARHRRHDEDDEQPVETEDEARDHRRRILRTQRAIAAVAPGVAQTVMEWEGATEAWEPLAELGPGVPSEWQEPAMTVLSGWTPSELMGADEVPTIVHGDGVIAWPT
jgi:hypothetical protein